MTTSIFNSYTLAIIPNVPGWAEIIVVLVIGLLIFGKRLPDVGRNLGKSIIEFKKGIKGISDDIDEGVDRKELDQASVEKSADLPPAKVTPDPDDEADVKVEESEE